MDLTRFRSSMLRHNFWVVYFAAVMSGKVKQTNLLKSVQVSNRRFQITRDVWTIREDQRIFVGRLPETIDEPPTNLS